MAKSNYRWKILGKLRKGRSSPDEVVDVLLENRGLTGIADKEEFLNPKLPENINLKELGISEKSMKTAIARVKKAVDNGEHILVYGDYDADGICATAMLWETLYKLNKNTTPYIPDRFSEGYGLNVESVSKLKIKNSKLSLIITVDNGIVAFEGVGKARELGIDVIITDHHEKGKKVPEAGIIHTNKLGGAGIAWIFAREIGKKLKIKSSNVKSSEGLELCAIGTVADQIPLIGPNRSIVKYGLQSLNDTHRPGLKCLYEEAGLKKGEIGTYQIGYIIAPRINAMGRLESAMDSLRILCTKDEIRALDLASLLGRTNNKRQQIVEEMVIHAKDWVNEGQLGSAIILAHEKYHEGIIGLAASRLVEEYWRPSIVVSKGRKVSKASARSIPGFNIIENIRKLEKFIIGGGGHPMAAGFSIETKNIEAFREEFIKLSTPLLNDEILTKAVRVDMNLPFDLIDRKLVDKLKVFEPVGMGNPTPAFATENVDIVDARTVGQEGRHLKLKVAKDKYRFDAIAFGMGGFYENLVAEAKYNIAYGLEENTWNGNTSIQLKIRDIKLSNSYE
jgi:single-stranded-DNA-specific exonuclease